MTENEKENDLVIKETENIQRESLIVTLTLPRTTIVSSNELNRVLMKLPPATSITYFVN